VRGISLGSLILIAGRRTLGFVGPARTVVFSAGMGSAIPIRLSLFVHWFPRSGFWLIAIIHAGKIAAH